MIPKDVIDSRAIALVLEHNASDDIPYLGTALFPPKKKDGIDLKWLIKKSGLTVSLAPSNFDAIPAVRARSGFSSEKTQMAFFREQMMVSEQDEQEIARIKESNDPYLRSVLQSIYDDAATLIRAAEIVPERMRMSLLATAKGHPVINIASDGVTYAYDYDPSGEYAKTHYLKLTGTAMWSDSENATPITDLNNCRKALLKIGKTAAYALMNSNTFQYLIDSKQVRNSILAQNLTATVELDDENVKSIVRSRAKLGILLCDKMYIDDEGKEQYFYPDNKVTLLPSTPLGSTWFGTTPEERTARQVADVDVSIYGTGIAIATKVEYGPPAKTTITASEIVLPSYENMNSTFVLEVADAA